jgi:hypothetical protein
LPANLILVYPFERLRPAGGVVAFSSSTAVGGRLDQGPIHKPIFEGKLPPAPEVLAKQAVPALKTLKKHDFTTKEFKPLQIKVRL